MICLVQHQACHDAMTVPCLRFHAGVKWNSCKNRQRFATSRGVDILESQVDSCVHPTKKKWNSATCRREIIEIIVQSPSFEFSWGFLKIGASPIFILFNGIFHVLFNQLLLGTPISGSPRSQGSDLLSWASSTKAGELQDPWAWWWRLLSAHWKTISWIPSYIYIYIRTSCIIINTYLHTHMYIYI